MVLALSLFASPAVAAPDKPPTEAEITSDIAASIDVENTITLTSSGKGKKQVLTFRPKPGAASRTSITTSTSTSGKMELPTGDKVDLPIPGAPVTTIGTLTTVGEPNAKGMIPVTVQYETIDVTGKGPTTDAVRDSLGELKNTSFDLLMRDGKIVQTDVSSDDQQMYELLQTMADQFFRDLTSFPEEPVGKGATYTVQTDVSIMGLSLEMHQDVTIVSIQGPLVTLHSDIDMKLGDSKLQIPGLPPDAKLDLSKFDGSGKGDSVVNLETMQSTGTSDITMNMDMSLEMAGQAMSMSMLMEQKTRMEDRK